MLKKYINKYMNIEMLAGIALFFSVLIAMLLMNSPFHIYYEQFVNYPLGISFGAIHLHKPLLFWINDGLICFFFFLIGLEIKRELFTGELSSTNLLILPCSAAVAGVVVPALIFTFFNYDFPINMRGWAIPTAMDTAFALGVLSLLGGYVPRSLRIFIMSVAIIDDILAVLIIAFFYVNEISHLAAIASVSILAILSLLNQAGVKRAFPYITLGFILWFFVLQSGVHTSIAGVILAFTIPLAPDNSGSSLLIQMEKRLHPWVAFAIIPVFAFTNSGISLQAFFFEKLSNPLSLGIIFGLFIGKQLGIMVVTWVLTKTKRVGLPTGASWLQMYGTSILCGIGFTMSLFIGSLSFENGGPEYNDLVKSGVYIGSLLSAFSGIVIFYISRLLKKPG